jgi:hypothetical protein
MKRKIISFVPNVLNYKNKKEGKMNKKSFISLLGLVFLMSLILTISAYGAEKFIVKDSNQVDKFVVTDQGKLGIGTTDPVGELHVVASQDSFYSGATRGITSAQHKDGAAAALMSFRRSRGTASAPTAVVNGDYVGFFAVSPYDGSNYIRSGAFGFRVDGPVSVGTLPVAVDFVTGTGESGGTRYGYERLTIASNGNIGVGVTAPTNPLQMASGAKCTAGGVWTNASSREYKENIKELGTDEALVAFNKLNPVTFNYKADANEKHVGFIAEDVPDLVASTDRKGLSPMDIVAVLTKVVQEQKKTISELTERINKLESMLK